MLAIQTRTCSDDDKARAQSLHMAEHSDYYGASLLRGLVLHKEAAKCDLAKMTSTCKNLVSEVKAVHGSLSTIITKVGESHASAMRHADTAQAAARLSDEAIKRARTAVAEAELHSTEALNAAKESETAAKESNVSLASALVQLAKITEILARAEADVGVVYEQRAD